MSSSSLFHDFWLKMFSLGMATLIWLLIHYGIRTDFALSQPRSNDVVSRELLKVPVSIITQPGDGRVFNVSPKEVVATAVAEEAILRKMTPGQLKLYVDLTEFGSNGPVNEPIHFHAPNGVDIININPPAVKVERISP